MKTCNRFKDLMVDALYEELKEGDRGFFQNHLENCPPCAAEYQEMCTAMGVMDRRHQPEMSEEFWDNFRPNLQISINESEAQTQPMGMGLSWLRQWWKGLNFKFDSRWILYPAAAMLVVVSGIVIGRYMYSPTGQDYVDSPVMAMSNTNPAVAEHFEDLRPMLVDYSNYSPQDEDEGSDEVLVDRETLKQLIVRNRLLKKMVERGKDANTMQLLEDLEMILLELSNSGTDSNNSETVETVQEMLKDYNVLFKMKVVNKKRKSTRL